MRELPYPGAVSSMIWLNGQDLGYGIIAVSHPVKDGDCEERIDNDPFQKDIDQRAVRSPTRRKGLVEAMAGVVTKFGACFN